MSGEGQSGNVHLLSWPLPDPLLAMQWIHVQRFSRRLLLALQDLMYVRLGGYCEAFESSACRALPWCR